MYYWSRPGLELIASEEGRHIEFGSLGELAEIAPRLLNPGEIAFVSAPFDPFAPGTIFVSDHTVQTSTDTLPNQESAKVSEMARMSASHDEQSWAELVNKALEQIANTELTKVVLAREIEIVLKNTLDLPNTLGALRSINPTAYVFCHGDFFGASPELLISRDGATVAAHPLAGTAKVGEDPEVARSHLLDSVKDQWEHKVTISWFLDSLLDFCSYVDAEPEPTIVEAANLFHLGTKVQGRLRSEPAHITELVAALHPTPAVGGEPQDLALDFISQHEGIDRRHYAGPTGWFDSEGNGEFAVAIRSGHVDKASVKTYAGVGIVDGSEPGAEFAETNAKLSAMLKALGLSGL